MGHEVRVKMKSVICSSSGGAVRRRRQRSAARAPRGDSRPVVAPRRARTR